MATIVNGNSTAIKAGSSLATFIASLQAVDQLRAVWVPISTDTTTTVNAGPTPVTWTQANTLAGRLSAQGTQGGQLATYNGTTDRATASDTLLPTGASARTMVALIKPTSVAVTDNPIFGYGTAAASQACMWELNTTKQRIGKFGANSGLATTVQVVGTTALVGFSLDGSGNITFYQNGAADGTTTLASMNTTLNGTAYIADAADPVTWGLGNKGNVTTGFFAIYAAALTAAQHASIKTAVNTYFGTSL